MRNHPLSKAALASTGVLKNDLIGLNRIDET